MIYEKITACGTPEGIPDCYIVSLGGSGVVSAEVEAELEAIGTVERVKGTPRYETSVEIAEYFFPGAESAVPAYAEDFPDGMCAGPLAHLLKMPLILTTNEWPTAADNYVGNFAFGIVTGVTDGISDETVRDIFELAADAEIVVR